MQVPEREIRVIVTKGKTVADPHRIETYVGYKNLLHFHGRHEDGREGPEVVKDIKAAGAHPSWLTIAKQPTGRNPAYILTVEGARKDDECQLRIDVEDVAANPVTPTIINVDPPPPGEDDPPERQRRGAAAAAG
jgi:hypothetical protein